MMKMSRGLFAGIMLVLSAGHLLAGNILIADFEGSDYGKWEAAGDAFGVAPAQGTLTRQQQVTGYLGKGLVNTFLKFDGSTGTLTSPPFKIERDYINLLIGGGSDADKVGVKLLVDGREVMRISGDSDEQLKSVSLDVKKLKGKTAVIEIFDHSKGGWGHINVDQIEQSDTLTRLASVPMYTRELTLSVSDTLLILPVANKGTAQMLSIYVDGVLIHKLNAVLARSEKELDWWGYLDVSEYLGKEIVLSLKDSEEGTTGKMIAFGNEPRTMPGQALYGEALRPQFHFSQMNGWNNDPNGMTYFDGAYHLFWQCNPLGNRWGNMYWGHASSPDMVNWTEHKRALRTFGGKTPLDQRHASMVTASAFSGGAHVDKDNTAGWKRGDKDVMFLMLTDTGLGESIAYSVDGGKNFEFWKGNPMFTHRGRDPKPVWHEASKQWVCAVYDEDPEKKKNENRNIAFWTSPNLKDWELQSKTYGFFECPEFFELPVDENPENKRWVLFGAKPDYLTGRFDGKKFISASSKKRNTIHGNIYAGQCFSNPPDGRVVYIGWARVGMGDAPFNQGFSIPLNLTLKTLKDGAVHLFAKPIKEIEQLREAPVLDVSGTELTSDKKSIRKDLDGQLYDICLKIKKVGHPKNVILDLGGFKVGYDFATEKLNGKYVPMTGSELTLRVLVDRPFAEVIAGDGYFYELINRGDKAGKALEQLSVTMDAGDGGRVLVESLQVYPMRSIWR